MQNENSIFDEILSLRIMGRKMNLHILLNGWNCKILLSVIASLKKIALYFKQLMNIIYRNINNN